MTNRILAFALITGLVAAAGRATGQPAAMPVLSSPVDPQPLPAVPPPVVAAKMVGYAFFGSHAVIAGDRLAVSGLICRKANHYGVPPGRVQIEAVGPDSMVSETRFAWVNDLGRQVDQRCAHYHGRLAWAVPAPQQVRVCLARRGTCAVGSHE